ncbi:DNA sulfur modification protein DndD [Oceanobacillus luteolus]|uniref:DNA sulfur modification protein DndD n=1 Tax=Oceanobacillus luteolus TaxID=1274358 RepID=UPI00203FB863|nr:DNA sulfur modification protein DndD [Oceanobacillus luteolus]MCM3741905.1 DNA sulfur modification protein DndD [Oceanobacillus luteolus]
MLLKKIIFSNYKTFYGQQEIDLYIPKDERENGKNIILIGGLNGAGKTTVLKAILYVLFGKRGMSEQEHERLFSSIINNTFFNEGGRQSSVSLIIETDAGEEWTLKVKWYFDKDSKKLNLEERELLISRPGVRAKKHANIQNIEAYNKYIDRIIPYHAAPFFIFDGEEIKEIILRQNSNEMKAAIHKITGMEAYNQLINDLKEMEKSTQRKLLNSVDNRKIQALQTDLDKVDQQIEQYEERKAKLLRKNKELSNALEEVKENRNKKLVQNSSSRETLVKKQSQLEIELNLAKEELSSTYKENIFGIILGEKIKLLKKQLNLEKEIRRNRLIEQSALKPYQEFINQLLSKKFNPPLTSDQLIQISEFGKEIWREQNNINIASLENETEIHDLSSKEQHLLLNYRISDKNTIIRLLNKIEKLENENEQIEEKMRKAPETLDIEEENNKIDSITKEIGALSLRIKSVNHNLNKYKNERTDIQNQLTRLSSKGTNIEEIKGEYQLLQQTIKAMEQYIHETTEMKAQFIQEEFSSILNKLFRKQDEFGKIEFDINTYTVRLYNDKLQEISIQDRSAGEMQMISSSLIWALTKVSDLSLPIVVDTPLGRLDSQHRNHLIKHYYKHISEQVIILSTDTEITDEYINLMSENSYKQFLLDYDEEKKYTIVRNGYFDFITQ